MVRHSIQWQLQITNQKSSRQLGSYSQVPSSSQLNRFSQLARRSYATTYTLEGRWVTYLAGQIALLYVKVATNTSSIQKYFSLCTYLSLQQQILQGSRSIFLYVSIFHLSIFLSIAIYLRQLRQLCQLATSYVYFSDLAQLARLYTYID